MPTKSLCALAIGFCAALPAAAAEFNVNLGDTALGQLSLRRDGAGTRLESRLDNTPLGVFNGSFTGISREVQADTGATVREFIGVSQSSRKSRKVTVQIDDGHATRVDIDPLSEQTDLSDISRVPDNVTDPASAVGALIDATDCPGVIRIYDGRRVIALTPESAAQDNGALVCDIAYTVIAGPGHLSPLRISSARMRLTYATSGSAQELQQIRMGSGIFTVTLDRVR